MHIEFLVEEPSAQVTLEILLPRLLPLQTTWHILTFSGKHDLLRKLPRLLRGYAGWMPDDYRIVVLVDEDRQDCINLKEQLEAAARQAGLSTKTGTQGGRFQVLNRIIVEELEAWFLGDPEALRAAYPNLPLGLPAVFSNPDAVSGGTWEALERWLQRYGYFQGGYRKIEAARQIAPHLHPDRNRSRSFHVFLEGLRALS
ncbi:MAG: DUF4276 family protein [Anaerolineales bacterium]|nr:DUF4276 family protein [Anaerolineales bacterium]MCX7755281.1 DUF4276 family protein [Anaerolineales bacterium]MDW8278472.1 DUF4276 family protein [Anaerolineales bacterium]